MSKSSACFICGNDFPFSELTAHEKICFDAMQTNDDTQYTRNDELSSSRSSLHDYSALSTNSTSSTESVEKKKIRCYICGSDVPSYLSSIHERSCKKSWENSLLTSASDQQHNGMRRGSSKNDVRNNSSSYLRKSHSVANIFSSSPDDHAFKKTSINKSSALKSSSLKSRSHANLSLSSKATPKRHSVTNDTQSMMNKTNSLQNLSGGKRKETPVYVECRTCGKQYSKHSINIHIRQCEKTLDLQKRAGTNNEYKKKSKSLHDLSAITPIRPSSANRGLTKKTSSIEILDRPATADPFSRKRNSLKNGLTVKKSLFTTPEKTPTKKSEPDISKPKTADRPPSATGLQKCYLCKQLFGSRSLPIHEKQCIKKWERSLEETKQEKKLQSQKDIKIVPFGKEKLIDTEKTIEENGITQENEKSEKSQPEKQPSYKRNLIRNKQKEKENDANLSNKSPKTFGFVNCVFCSRSYGHHSIEIHEKNCRERNNVVKKTEERITERAKRNSIKDDKQLLDSLSTNQKLDLVTCNDCNRKFLASAIEKHRTHCKAIVL